MKDYHIFKFDKRCAFKKKVIKAVKKIHQNLFESKEKLKVMKLETIFIKF